MAQGLHGGSGEAEQRGRHDDGGSSGSHVGGSGRTEALTTVCPLERSNPEFTEKSVQLHS